MEPLPGSIEAVKLLSHYFDCYILSTAPWKNIPAWSDKATWVQKYFGNNKESPFFKRLIISHHKNLNKDDFLIDDRTKNGAGEFDGELILFGSEKFPDWDEVIEYLLDSISRVDYFAVEYKTEDYLTKLQYFYGWNTRTCSFVFVKDGTFFLPNLKGNLRYGGIIGVRVINTAIAL